MDDVKKEVKMAIKTRDEILAMIKAALGEDVSDENIAIYI